MEKKEAGKEREEQTAGPSVPSLKPRESYIDRLVLHLFNTDAEASS